MYEYLKGRITQIAPGAIVLETKDGVGYRIYPANPYHFEVNQEAQVFVEQIVRETELSLYGFATVVEKQLFVKLLNVSGIGPKSALAILAGAQPADLVAAIENSQVDYLTQFPGVGKKTAQQIVLDLAGKMADFSTLAEQATTTFAEASETAANRSNLEDALAALEALGYASRDLTKVKKSLVGESGTTSELVSKGLKLLVQG
ncbi:Holliday junction branch migration protein RuvA [Fructobacillus fructosus]|uniref:Holliday junction branch migration complex subunit RuvA n=1 Tax=Fructobacillus fructosus TaxID=1631 RepID=A0ABM9MY50_9LACO|nr:Holliday junction branch migration protein RuvA [Fructobacillus fructosus]MBD9364903.1 Holliday junction branch migration protein RuvA [Leuconostoc mesenteroides]KRN51845.1 Holliday junction DNA helicase RuvA [Fructobacillus fructosus KCTC 3544]MBC9118426.1 Holliday junction branch migration protein RuvA [Fructobacillus fructosus]MCK8638723.1 Holliday junction branch migration protein RuvA [Fructobacillus fructosus]CAK1248445.1 Holliday junction resolvasome RuvABC DNA-binding subunit (RuvA)